MTNGTQGVAGVGLLVAAYVDERRADDTLESLKQARDAQQFYFDDAAVVRRDAGGKIYINETGDMSTGTGAGIGALIGGIIGIRRLTEDQTIVGVSTVAALAPAVLAITLSLGFAPSLTTTSSTATRLSIRALAGTERQVPGARVPAIGPSG